MGRFSELSECELLTMKCIWDAGNPVSAQEIMEQLKNIYGLDYRDTTVYTYLKHLGEKKFIDSFKRGVTYYYPTRDKDEYRKQQIEWIRQFWFKGSKKAMVAALFQRRDVTEEEREKMRDVINSITLEKA